MPVTIEAIQARQTELAAMIQAFQEQATAVTFIEIEETTIELQPGERYAGLLLDDEGEPLHHLVLLPGDVEVTWSDAHKLAAEAGGELPTRREQSLLFANLKGEFKADWYWSGDQYSEDYAWSQGFYYGQGYTHKDYERRCRVVRRLVL